MPVHKFSHQRHLTENHTGLRFSSLELKRRGEMVWTAEIAEFSQYQSKRIWKEGFGKERSGIYLILQKQILVSAQVIRKECYWKRDWIPSIISSISVRSRTSDSMVRGGEPKLTNAAVTEISGNTNSSFPGSLKREIAQCMILTLFINSSEVVSTLVRWHPSFPHFSPLSPVQKTMHNPTPSYPYDTTPEQIGKYEINQLGFPYGAGNRSA